MKVSDKLTVYELPPEDPIKGNVEAWREDYIYNSAEADAYEHLLQLFSDQMDKELEQWLREVIEIRRNRAIKSDERHRELSIKLWSKKE